MACNHNCATCKDSSCKDRNASLLVETAKENKIKKIIGIVSGKGGVGKSSVTSLVAVNLAKKGYKVGIMDADITGPSIPAAFGITEGLYGSGELMYPASTTLGIKVVSVNLLIDNPTTPVLLRGPVIGGMVKQFYTDVLWEELDFLLIDMPPGTGDVALTIFQSLPIDSVVIVTTPQDLVAMIVGKAVNMCKKMNVNMLGLVENMSYIECSCCGEKLHPFGNSKLEEVAAMYEINALEALPINPDLANLIDQGLIESVEADVVNNTAEAIIKLL